METEDKQILGIQMGPNSKRANEITWRNTVGGIEKRLKFWENRNLTIKGKILVINVLMVRIIGNTNALNDIQENQANATTFSVGERKGEGAI